MLFCEIINDKQWSSYAQLCILFNDYLLNTAIIQASIVASIPVHKLYHDFTIYFYKHDSLNFRVIVA